MMKVIGLFKSPLTNRYTRMETHMHRLIVAGFALWSLIASPTYGEQGETTATVFTEDGAWCWFQDPRAVYVRGKHEQTYAQWMTRKGELQIGAYDHETGEILIHTLKENWDQDDHNTGAFLVLPNKRLMAFYAQHCKQELFCRTTSNPEDISQWEDEVTISNSDNITYAHPVYLSEEKKYYVFWRGPSWKPTFATSSDGISWSDPQILIQESGRESTSIRPYLKVISNGESSIHFMFTDGHPRDEVENSVYYLKYEKDQFIKANGDRVGSMRDLPIPHKSSDLVYDGSSETGRAWIWDIAIDEQGFPVIAYTRLPTETNHRYCTARWTGKQWLDVEITPGGKWFPQTPEGHTEPEPHYSGGMAIDHADPSTLYVSRPISGIFEIEQWSSPDQGKTWTSIAMTQKSTQNNIRPLVPRGTPKDKQIVLWMFGEYTHYTNYGTGIQLLEVED